METSDKRLILEWRAMSLYHPFFFIKSVLNNPLVEHDPHGKVIDLALANMIAGHRFQLIELPRRFLKTTIFTTGLAIWLVLPTTDEDKAYALNEMKVDPARWDALEKLRDQNHTQLLAFETFDNAKKKVGEVRVQFEANPLFRWLYPEIAHDGTERPWSDESIKIRRTGRGQRVQEGSFDAIGRGGALQSRHYTIVWEDDIVGERAAKSEIELADTIDWHQKLSGAEMPGRVTWRFMVGNRWTLTDANSYVRSTEIDWKIYSMKSYEIDPDTGKEKPTWPKVYPMEALDEIRRSMGDANFYAQMQNDPRPLGRQEVLSDNIHEYSVRDTGEMACTCGKRFWASGLNRYILYDPYNAKGKRSKSCPAIAIVGLSEDRHVFLLDYYMTKATYTKLFEKLLEFNDRWQPLALHYEDVGHQNMMEHHLKSMEKAPEFSSQKHKPLPRIVPVSAKSTATEIRVRDSLVPVLEGKNGCFAVRKGHRLLYDMLDTWPLDVPGHDYDLLAALVLGPTAPWRFPIDRDTMEASQREEEKYLAQLGKGYSTYEVPAR